MILSKPDNKKLLRSLGISVGAVILVYVLRFAFPSFDWVSIETAVLTAVGAWLVNTVRESLK